MIVVQVFGSAIITCGEHRFRDPGSRRFAVALYLAAESGRRLDRAATQALLFSDQAERNAAHSLRQYLYKFSQQGFPIRAGRTELFTPADAVETDIGAMLRAPRLTPDDFTAIGGGILAGATVPELPRFNEWLEDYRAGLERDLQRALVRHLGAARDAGDWGTAERAARACLALDPLNEEATLGLAESLAISGSKAAAVKLLDDYAAEVGISTDDLRIPAKVLRRRIAERLPDVSHRSRAELPFVGRQEEMRVLTEALRRARAGEGQCVLIHGEPGIGKTRLAAEFANLAVLEGARLVRVAAQPHDVHRPLAAFADLVPALLELPGALGCSPDSMEALRQLIGKPTGTAGAQLETLAPEARYSRITTSIRDLMDSVVAECLLAVVLEDAHWSDPLSLQLIGGLSGQGTERRLLIIMTSRDRSPLSASDQRRTKMDIVHVQPLIAEAASNLATAALACAGDADSSELVQRVRDAAGGNPLFVISLAEHWRRPEARFSVPRSVTSLLGTRFERLSGHAATVMHMIIVLGRYCTLRRVAKCLEVASLELATALQELEEASLVRSEDAELHAAHPLIAECGLRHATPSKLRWLHARAASVLETEMTDDADVAMLSQIGQHLIAAGEVNSAFSMLDRCAAAAAIIGRPAEAAEIFDRAGRLVPAADQEKFLQRAAFYAAGAGESPRTLELVAELRSRGANVPSALALHELTGLVHIDQAPGSSVEQIRTLVSADPSPSTRMHAAFLLLKLADRFRDLGLAREARTLFDGVEGKHRRHRLEFSLIYTTSFGDPQESATIANDLLDALAGLSGAERVALQYNASQALLHAGEVDRSVEIFTRIHEEGARMALARFPTLAAIQLACISRNTSDLGAVNTWSERVEHLVEVHPVLRDIAYYVFSADAELFAQRYEKVITLAQHIQRMGRSSASQRTLRWGEVLEVAAKQLLRVEHSKAVWIQDIDVDSLRGFDADDLLATVKARQLLLDEQAQAAKDALATYLQKRTSRSPHHHALQDLARILAQSSS